MSGTTNIFDLPADPTGGGGGSTIGFSAAEKNTESQPIMSGNMSLDQTTINQIVDGLQKASPSGLTQLPSRDIPQTTDTIVQDPHVQPNYIQPVQNNDFIREYDTNEDIIHNYEKKEDYYNTMDHIYEEIQTPLLLAALYFLFQLPIFKKYMFTYIPMLFSKDGNINLNGYFFTSILFALSFYIINMITTKLL